MRPPDAYFPCLAPEEQGAVRLVYSSFVPTYYVVPVAPITAYFESLANNFPGRQALFELAFRVTKDTVEVPPLPEPIEVYFGFYEFYLSWILYDPIAYGTAPRNCEIKIYP